MASCEIMTVEFEQVKEIVREFDKTIAAKASKAMVDHLYAQV